MLIMNSLQNSYSALAGWAYASKLLYGNVVEAVGACALVVSDDDETSKIPVITGSAAEFYIEPMLSCVGDHDLMFHRSDELAIPTGTAPPTQLPDEFDSNVNVCDIVDSNFAGYVYLVSSYLLTERIDDGKYSAMKCQRWWMGYKMLHRNHGPALVAEQSIPHLQSVAQLTRSRESIDFVSCYRCLSWPPQAADWPTRHGNYGWPDSATIYYVVSNGCDVVPVVHRQCRQDKCTRHRQYRLSFSRAEIVLLNSWIPVQQIVYHTLRVLVKTEQLTDSANNSDAATLSNYLRSAARGDLAVPRARTTTYGQRSFSVSGPSLWNSLPLSVRDPSLTMTRFCTHLKTFLFRRAYYN